MLTSGDRIRSYEIVAPIGTGRMGEVYRARDNKLNREVAFKVLPDEFAQDGERLARFKRETQVLASLNHPNIAAIYGLEESDETLALALEPVEGLTVSRVVAEGKGVFAALCVPRALWNGGVRAETQRTAKHAKSEASWTEI